MKKTLSILLVLACFLCLVACKNPVTPSPTKRADVNIKALTASVSKPAEVSAEIKAQSKIVRLADGDDGEQAPLTVSMQHAQYVIMYKSEKDIKFTIELDNPKGQSIDAVELKCDDPNATILVSGEWEKLSSKDGYVVNWASENAYRKTYYLQTISQDSINTLTVSDIKVNGEWQNAALDNDQLKIYKMDDEDLKWDFISNTPSGYKWKFDCSEKVSNLVVKVGDDVLTADENGVYTVEHDCKVSWTWDYATGDVLGNGTEVVNHWDNEREIVLLTIENHLGRLDNKYEFGHWEGNTAEFTFWFNVSTATDFDKIIFKINNFDTYFKLDISPRGDLFVDDFDFSIPDEEIRLYINGIEITFIEFWHLR